MNPCDNVRLATVRQACLAIVRHWTLRALTHASMAAHTESASISLSSAFAGHCMHPLSGTPRPGYSWGSLASSSTLGHGYLGLGRYTVHALQSWPTCLCSRGSDGGSLTKLLIPSELKRILI